MRSLMSVISLLNAVKNPDTLNPITSKSAGPIGACSDKISQNLVKLIYL